MRSWPRSAARSASFFCGPSALESPAARATFSLVTSNAISSRRCKRSPGVVGQLLVLRNGKRLGAEGAHNPGAARTAAGSPSRAKGTPLSDGIDLRTKVISGCTEATPAPRCRRARSSSLARAPLECSAILPFHSTTSAKCRAARAISRSGTQNQTRSASKGAPAAVHRACYLPGESPTLAAGCAALSGDDCADAISRAPEFQRQRAPQPSRPHNRDAKFGCHRRSIAFRFAAKPRRRTKRRRETLPSGFVRIPTCPRCPLLYSISHAQSP